MISDIRRVLEGVKDAGDGFTARCPAHKDDKNSLKVDPKGDGGVLLRCYAGCSFEAIRDALKALGVKFERPKDAPPRSSSNTTRYEVRDAAGKLLATKCRTDPGKIIWWELPDGTRGLKDSGLRTEDMLYRVEALAALPDRAVVICEGEKAARALYRLGVETALGTTGGANSSLSTKVLEALRGRDVYLWPDNDDPGRKHMASIRAKLIGIASAVYTIRWEGAPDKGDAADWTPRKTIADFTALAKASMQTPAPAWSRPFKDAMLAFQRELDRRIKREEADVIPTQIPELDDNLGGGFRPGEVYLFGAPTGGGKTTIMQNFAIRTAKQGKRVLMVSPEMTLEEIGKRAAVFERQGILTVWGNNPAVSDPFVLAVAKLIDLPIVLADKVDIVMQDVVIEAERLSKEDEGLGLVIVDYAQQVVDDEDTRRPRYLAVGDVIEYAVKIAKTLSIPVLVASQVNTITEVLKDGTRKRSYTFRESQKLEHKASVVLIFDRKDPRDPDAEDVEDDDVNAKLICTKNRLGIQFRRVPVVWKKALYTVAPGPWLTKPTVNETQTIVAAGSAAPALPPPREEDQLKMDQLYRNSNEMD